MPLEDHDIEYIKQQYLCCVAIKRFRFTKSNAHFDGPLDYDTQMKIFENTIEDSYSLKYPSRLAYRIAFLRMLIEKSENGDGNEVYDKLYETLTNYMMLNDETNTTHYRQFLLKQYDTADRIILQESKNLISEGTTGLRTWQKKKCFNRRLLVYSENYQAGFALAEWCYENRLKLSEKFVLELGSGIGFTGLSVIATCAPKRYTFSDCHSSVLDMLVKNVQRNFAQDPETRCESLRTVEWNEESYRTIYKNTDVRITRLAWSSIKESDGDASWANPDVLLAADVVYDETLFDDLIDALKIFIARSNALVIIAATVRNSETLEEFFKKLGDYGLSFEDEALPKPNLYLQLDETPVRILKIYNKD